jgi:hypothetical protein
MTQKLHIIYMQVKHFLTGIRMFLPSKLPGGLVRYSSSKHSDPGTSRKEGMTWSLVDPCLLYVPDTHKGDIETCVQYTIRSLDELFAMYPVSNLDHRQLCVPCGDDIAAKKQR